MVEEKYVLEMGGKEIGKFVNQKKAVSEFNRIRRELEVTTPPVQFDDSERRSMLNRYLADNLVSDIPDRAPARKRSRSRTFG